MGPPHSHAPPQGMRGPAPGYGHGAWDFHSGGFAHPHARPLPPLQAGSGPGASQDHRAPPPASAGLPASSLPLATHTKLGLTDEAEVHLIVSAAARWVAASAGPALGGGETSADGSTGPTKPSSDTGAPSGDGRPARQPMADSKDDATSTTPGGTGDDSTAPVEATSEADSASLRRLAFSPASDPAAVSRAQMHIRYLAAQDQASFLDQVRSLAGKEDYKAAIAALALGHSVQPAAGSTPASRGPDSAMPGGGLQAGAPGKHPHGAARPDWGGQPRDPARRPAPLTVHGDGSSRGPSGPGTPSSFNGHSPYSPVVAGPGMQHPPSRPFPGGANGGAPPFPGMRHGGGTSPHMFGPAFFGGRPMYYPPPPGTPPAQAIPSGGFGYHEAPGHGPRGPSRFGGPPPPQQQWSDAAAAYAPHPASPGTAAGRGQHRMPGAPTSGAGPAGNGPEFHFAEGGGHGPREAVPHGHPLHGDSRKVYGAAPAQDVRRQSDTAGAHHASDEGGVAAAAMAMASLRLDDEPTSRRALPTTSAPPSASASHAGQGLSTDSPAFSMDSWPSLAHDAAAPPGDSAAAQPRLELGFGGGALSSGLGNYGSTGLDGSGSLGLWHASALPGFGLSHDSQSHEVGGADDLM